MSDFVQSALARGPEHRTTHSDVIEWAGTLDSGNFYNATALQIARLYNDGELTYSFCDALMNDLWSAAQAGFGAGSNHVPQPFFDIYEAFDAGEYHRKPDKSDDPVAEFTNPVIAELVTRYCHY